MIEQKQHDWVLNLMLNPQASVSDLNAAGLDTTNTSLLDEETYKLSSQILLNPMFQDENGNFDDDKFHKFYTDAIYTYNMLANDTYLKDLMEQLTTYGKDDLWAPEKQKRKLVAEYKLTHNPDRTTLSIIRLGELAESNNSVSENGQTLKVLANPTEVYDENEEPNWDKAIWHDAPNDSWTTDFWDTRVLATYEKDGFHVDPLTGETVEHKKGQPKLNENGTYYYENLDGRDIYGKLVLNKMNTLTVDGSYWNTYDFFDSDGLEEKSIGGTVLKNAVLVGSMFIPYVGPWIAAASISSQLIGLFGTLGKMVLVDSNSPTLSALEGWSKSISRQTAKSQYAQENTWCWENFINLIGDVAGQLVEQRVLFEYAPGIIKNFDFKGISEDKLDDMLKVTTEKYAALNQTKFESIKAAREALGKPLTQKEMNLFLLKQNAISTEAKATVQNFMQEYQKLGSILSKGYMTAITVADTYGEAKYEAKASDLEATALTLGYAIGEYLLLSSDIGSWIMPELRANKIKTKALIRAIANVPEKMRINNKELLKNAGKKNKIELIKYWIGIGKNVAEESLSGAKGILKLAGIGALAEGFEETSEELLADFSKQCFNTIQWLNGSDKRVRAWDNMKDRYLMSFFGGALGGGLTSLGTSFKMQNTNYTTEQAVQELVWMLREGKKNEIYESLDKITLANPYLQADALVQYDGSVVQKPGTIKSNLDTNLKKIIKQNIDLLDDLIKGEGLQITDNEFLSRQTLKDLRIAVLQNSPISSSYIQDFNSTVVKLMNIKEQINNINAKKGDLKTDELSDLDKQELSLANQNLLATRNKINSYLNGDYAMDFISKSLLTLTPDISQYFTTVFFKDFVQQKLNRSVESLSTEEMKKYREEFDTWKATEFKDKISEIAPIFLSIAKNSNLFILKFASNYNKLKLNKDIQSIVELRMMSDLKHQSLLDVEGNPEDKWANEFKKLINSEVARTLLTLLKNKNLTLYNTINKENDYNKAATLLFKEFTSNPEFYFDDFIKTGVINPEIKYLLNKTIEDSKLYLIDNNKRISKSNLYDILESIEEDIETKNIDEAITIFSGFGEELVELNINPEDLIYLENIYGEINTFGDLIEINKTINGNISKLDQLKSKLNTLTYTDTINFILNVLQENSDTKLNIIELFNTINGLINLQDLENINLSSIIDQINEASNIINMMKALIVAARTDESLSLGNLIGYNVTLNEIARKYNKEWEQLPEISSEDADIIFQDLGLLESKLVSAKAIYYLNEGKKLIVHDKIAANKIKIIYNRLNKFIIDISDEFIGKEDLKKALEEAKLIKNLSSFSLTESLKVTLEKEITKIEDAIYTIFNSNDSSKFYQLFKNFDFYDIAPLYIDETTEILSDRNFLSYLASRASVKKSAFLNEFRQVIEAEKGIAPVSVQEECIYSDIAEVLNGNMTTKIYDAFNKAVIEDFNSKSPDDKLTSLKRTGKDSDIIKDIIKNGLINSKDILYELSNMHLTEGDAGTGKSSGVKYYTLKILKLFHPEFVKNIWLAHGDIERADKSKKDLEIENAKSLDHDTLMRTIYSSYDISRKRNKEGTLIYTEEDVVYEQNDFKFKGNPDIIKNIPDLIVIDEVSHYDQFDLLLLNTFAKQHGITILVSGDFNQSLNYAELEYNGETYIITAYRNMFKHSMPMGISMRTSNLQMDKSLNNFKLERINGFKKPIDFYYYKNSKIGINGIKKLEENDIELMFSTTNEKIGLIYYSDDSSFVKELTSKYPDKFDLKKGSAAQGLEGLYYIIDFTGIDLNKQGINNDFYTAITRALQGVLITGISPLAFNSIQEFQTIKNLPPIKGYQNYSKNRKSVLNNIETNETIKPIQRFTIDKPIIEKKKEQTEATKITSNLPTNEIENGISIKYEGNIYITNGKNVYLNNNEVIDEEIKNKIFDIFNNLSKEKTELTLLNELKEPVEINTSDHPINEESTFTYLLHSHNTLDLGVDSDKEGNIKFYDKDLRRYENRIDGIFGLMKFYEFDWKNPIKKIHEYENIISKLRNNLLSIDDKSKLIESLSYVLSNDEKMILVKDVIFGYFSSPRINKNNLYWGSNKINKYSIFDKHINEKTVLNDNTNEEAQKVNRKTLGATIILENGNKVYIPLFVLGNLDTLDKNPKSNIAKKIAELWEKYGGGYEFHQAILNDPHIEESYPIIWDIAKLWTFTGGGYFNIDNPNWLPAKNLKNYGTQVNTYSFAGNYLEFDGKKQNTSLQQLKNKKGYSVSTDIYTTLEPIYDENNIGYWIGNKGHCFVLVSQDPSLKTDEQLQKLYQKQVLNPNESKKVNRIYVIPPKVSIKDYLINLYDIVYNKDKSSVKKLGSNLTSYYIWKALLPKLKLSNTIFDKYLTRDNKDIIIEYLEKLIQNDELVSYVMSNITLNNVPTLTQSLQNHLNYFLLSMITDFSNHELLEDNLNQLTSEIENSGIKEIYYSAKFKNKERHSDLIFVPIESADFTINAKIDSSLFATSVNINKSVELKENPETFEEIIHSFVSKIKSNGENLISIDSDNYINNTLNSNLDIRNTYLKYMKDEYLDLKDIDLIEEEYNTTGKVETSTLWNVYKNYCKKVNNQGGCLVYSSNNNPFELKHHFNKDYKEITTDLFALNFENNLSEIKIDDNTILKIDVINDKLIMGVIPKMIQSEETKVDYSNKYINEFYDELHDEIDSKLKASKLKENALNYLYNHLNNSFLNLKDDKLNKIFVKILEKIEVPSENLKNILNYLKDPNQTTCLIIIK